MPWEIKGVNPLCELTVYETPGGGVVLAVEDNHSVALMELNAEQTEEVIRALTTARQEVADGG